MQRTARSQWLAIWAQARRRKRAAVNATPNAPVIINGGFAWDVTEAGMADVWIAWTFDHGTFPVATVEIWQSINAAPMALQVTLPSSETTYYQPSATESELLFAFQMRYRNGATLGPFSNVYPVNVFI